MDTTSIIMGWQARLVALADDPPYAYRDTSTELIAEHYRRLTTFAGYPETMVAGVERSLGFEFPTLFRAFLMQMAKSPGDLFRGSSIAGPANLRHFRTDALDLMAETNATLTLPTNAVIFLFHQGYSVCYLLADGRNDGPVWQWTEGDAAPSQICAGFAEFVDAEIKAMELNRRESHALGGYYLTLHRGGGQTESHAALSSAERPFPVLRKGTDAN